MTAASSLIALFAAGLASDELFDAVPDTVFFVKDRAGCYLAVNRTLVERTGRETKADLIGRSADEIFPGALGRRIAEQDRAIMERGTLLAAELELHLYADGREGWCLTWKSPLRGADGLVAGLYGMSRDIHPLGDGPADTGAISKVLADVRANLDHPYRVSDLAARAGLSTFRFDQRLRQLFGMSAGQYLTRLRIDHACGLLRHTATPIADIALQSGYQDQTAFTRQFRKVVRLTPQKYRSERQ